MFDQGFGVLLDFQERTDSDVSVVGTALQSRAKPPQLGPALMATALAKAKLGAGWQLRVPDLSDLREACCEYGDYVLGIYCWA